MSTLKSAAMGTKKKWFSQSDHPVAKPLRSHAWVSANMSDLHHQEAPRAGQVKFLQPFTNGQKLVIVWTQKCMLLGRRRRVSAQPPNPQKGRNLK
jgi:hypothetical protein